MARRMVALVIGNADYPGKAALTNPGNDANDVSTKLTTYGFEVITRVDVKVKIMDKALKQFRTALADASVGLFFFAGHGLQIDGRNYLLATDSDTTEEIDAKHSSLSLDRVIDVLEKSSASTKIVILDACRTNPWDRAWHRSAETRGLASVYAPKGTIIGFATSPGQVAYDGSERNGVYTSALLQHIDSPDTTIEMMFKRVRNTVAAATSGRQVTWEHTSLSGEFFFNMSLGEIIKLYPVTSLADSMFVIDETKTSHKIIRGLKSYNWYTQNDALDDLTPHNVKRMSADNLFVIGRNIYQAACGGANAAKELIRSFESKTKDYPAVKQKSLLDGILFEIFFNRSGQLRKKIKANFFNEAFDLQRTNKLKPSFDFIAESIVAAHADVYTVPGRGHSLSVTVTTGKSGEVYRVKNVYVGGIDVLHPEDDEVLDDDQNDRRYARSTLEKFEEKLSEELVVPKRLLQVTYTPAAAKSKLLGVPVGYTVRKE